MINPNLPSLLFTSLLASLINGALAATGDHEFSYKMDAPNGPNNWGHIDPNWELCSNGKMQSPVNIEAREVQVVNTLGSFVRAYKPAPAKIFRKSDDVMLSWADQDAGKVQINGTDYNPIQCHWHTPSEHTIDGKRFDMEMHMVHTNPQSEIAVLSVLYSIGEPDPFLATLEEKIKAADKTGMDLGVVNPESIDTSSVTNFRYIGSLTTPPCTEGVIWTIAEKVRTVSPEQVGILKNCFTGECNSRPIQLLEGRTIWSFSILALKIKRVWLQN